MSTRATATRRTVAGTVTTVAALGSGDLPRVAVVHAGAFPRAALTALGPEAVRRYYAWQLDGPHDAVALGAFNDEGLEGFCFAGVYRGAMSGFLARNRAFLAGRLLLRPVALADPAFRERVTRALGILRRANAATAPPAPRPVPSFGVLAIATAPNRQGRGVGAALMRAAEATARDRGFARMHLTVDVANDGAIRFYERLGWEKVATSGAWKGAMVRVIA